MNIRISFLFSIVLFTGCSSTPSISPSIVTKLTGTWDEGSPHTCGSNYHTISFNDSALELKYVEKGYVSESKGRQILKYTILSDDNDLLRVQLVNETRLDIKGKPVVWHIKPAENDQYCWGRDDWPKNACTPPRFKCEPKKAIK